MTKYLFNLNFYSKSGIVKLWGFVAPFLETLKHPWPLA